MKVRTIHERTARKIATGAYIVFMTCAVLMAAIICSGRATAEPGIGCESIRWGFLGLQWRTICDGPRQADGSWLRARRVWTPAGYVPYRSYCGTWSCTSSGGYYREESTTAYEEYTVFDSNVLPDEPGWLPAGTVVVR
jgi:hypothetical protein